MISRPEYHPDEPTVLRTVKLSSTGFGYAEFRLVDARAVRTATAPLFSAQLQPIH